MPSKNNSLTPSHWQLSYMPGRDSTSGSGERQLAVSGNAFNHTAIRAGPCVELYSLRTFIITGIIGNQNEISLIVILFAISKPNYD